MTAPTPPSRTHGAVRRPRPGDIDHLVASAAVTLLSVVTAVAMCRVFADWAFLDTLLVVVAVSGSTGNQGQGLLVQCEIEEPGT